MLSGVEAALFVFVLATAIATALFRDVLAVIIVFSAYSLGMAIFYAVLKAPDVSMTEAAIGAGVTNLLLLLTLAMTARPPGERLIERPSIPGLLVTGAFAVVLVVTITAFPPVGDPSAPAWAHPEISQYYLEAAYTDTGVENVVTAVLAGYRGFDTFGEATVVFAAGAAALIVLHKEVFVRE